MCHFFDTETLKATVLKPGASEFPPILIWSASKHCSEAGIGYK